LTKHLPSTFYLKPPVSLSVSIRPNKFLTSDQRPNDVANVIVKQIYIFRVLMSPNEDDIFTQDLHVFFLK